MDINAEREKIRLEIQELERSLGPSLPCTEVQVSDSSLESASDDGDDLENGDGNSDSHVDMEVDPGGVKEAEQEQEGGVVIYLPHTPETCLQMNLVYQEVIQEKMVEINLLLAQNKEQQEKLMWELAGARGTKSGSRKTLPANMFLGHFMKPYFKDKTSGIGPPANSDAHEKARQGIKSFEELITIKWKSREKLLLRQSVLSDQLQHLLQPKLLKLDYLNEKREKAKDEVARQIFEKQIQETEREITDINLLPEEALLGSKSDEHDWDKIANISFEGTRSGKELRKYWQNSEHPSINKKEWGEEEIARLKEVAARHRFVGWEAVAQELGTQRTAFQCLQKFQAYNKDFKRSEWAPEEDQMLLHLVQEMRVGSHIPYRKIAYYMEGRNSAQLIYRWTKCVDPNLKRGAWTPREDALLLKAVAKYGPRDWYKIRAEVPGRTDTQCRDRYLHALHYDIKKGKWSEEEERKLVELTEKYGVGHWAKIAAELPHRSGSQCLSKWKVLLGYRGNRRKKQGNRLCRKRRRAQREDLWETSSEDSELEVELELELGEGGSTEEEDEAPRPRAEGRWRVPSIDLWVPARRGALGAQPEELPSVTLLSKGFDVNREQKPPCRAFPGGQEHAAAEGSGGGMLQPEQGHVQDGPSEEGDGPSACPKDSWRVSLAYVKSVLRRNSYELQRRSREITRKKRFLSAAQAGPERSMVPTASRPFGNPRPKDGMWKTTLYRRLMMAIAPWAGSAVQAWALQAKAEASRKSKVELISKQLQTAHLTSTPVFTLLIQLLRIDVNGCMKVIQKRRAPQSELLKAVAANAGEEQPLAKAPLAQNAKAQRSLQTSAPHPGKRLIPLKAKEGPAPASSRAARCSGSAPKPKTVSELLREKRLREAKVKKAEQRRLLLAAPPLLLPSSVIIRPQGPPAAQGLSSLQGTPSGQVSLLPAALPVTASAPPPEMDRVPLQATSRNVYEARAVVSRERADAPGNGAPHGHRGATPPSQASASFPAPQASVGGPPGPSPSLDPAGTGDPSSSSPPAVAATAAAPQPGSGALPKAVLPITWVLTPQGLIPMTIVGLPSQGKLPVAAPAAPPQLGQGTVAPSPQAPAVGAVLAAGGSSQAPPGARVQERLSGSPQPSGVVQQAASAPPSQPLPAPPRGLSETLPTTRPPASPSHDASSQSTRPVSPTGAAPALAHPSQVGGSPPPPAPPQPGKAPPGPEAQPPAPHEHRLSPDYGLLSQEDPAAVKGWVSAGAAAHLPCLPPFLCSLRTVGALLLNKEALERAAAPLVAPGGRPDGLGQAGLGALRGLVHQRLGANPAYQLLRSRFLAAFTFPAALAALPPCRVTTTLSGGRWWESSSGEDSSPSEEEEEEEEDDDNDEAAEESQKTTLDKPGRTADAGEEQEETNTDSTASVPWSTPTFRRSTRLRKRRRQL